MPLNSKNNQCRGFGFVEFETKEMALDAIKGMDGQMFKGRPLTVELSLPKNSYETKVQHLIENTNMDHKTAVQPKSVKD